MLSSSSSSSLHARKWLITWIYKHLIVTQTSFHKRFQATTRLHRWIDRLHEAFVSILYDDDYLHTCGSKVNSQWNAFYEELFDVFFALYSYEMRLCLHKHNSSFPQANLQRIFQTNNNSNLLGDSQLASR